MSRVKIGKLPDEALNPYHELEMDEETEEVFTVSAICNRCNNQLPVTIIGRMKIVMCDKCNELNLIK